MVRRVDVLVVLLFLALLLPVLASVSSGPVTIQSPTDGTNVTRNVSINVSFTGPANVTIMLNNVTFFFSENQSSPYNVTWQTNNGSFPDGDYVILVNVTNATNASDWASNSSVMVRVDNTPPRVENQGVNVSIGESTTPLLVNVTVTDTTIVSTVSVRNTSVVNLSLSNGSTYQVTTNATALGCPEGVCQLQFQAFDGFGYENSTTTTTITIDDTNPAVFDARVNSTNVSYYGSVRIRVNVTDTTPLTVTAGNATVLNMSLSAPDQYELNTTRAALGCPVGVCTISFTATDSLGHVNGTETTNVTFSPPVFVAGSVVFVEPAENQTVFGDTPVNLTYNGTANVTLEYSLVGPWIGIDTQVNVANYTFLWPTANGSFVDFTYTLRATVTNSLNASDSEQVTVTGIVVDNSGPYLFGLSFTDNSLANDTQVITITVNATDLRNISSVLLSNGTLNLSLTNTTNNLTNSQYTITLNASVFGCRNESLCNLTFYANDSLGNTNSNLTTGEGPLYVDTIPPVLLTNTTSNATPLPKDNLTISARWQEVTLFDLPTLTYWLEISRGGGAFTTEPYDTARVEGNDTNLSLLVKGSDEGASLTYRIVLNDSQGRTNTTENLTVIVQNVSPLLAVTNFVNGTLLEQKDNLSLRLDELGSGLNLSSLTLNASNTTIITYADNNSLFSCAGAYNVTAALDNRTCNVSMSWLALGTYNITITVSDAAQNLGGTTYEFSVVDVPDIVNITFNDNLVLNATPLPEHSISFNAPSQEVTVNWTVAVTVPINTTTIAFTNSTFPQLFTTQAVPASRRLNFTAGKNYMTINTTINNSLLTDSVSLNVTANVPLNLSALQDQYERGMVSSWTVREGGTDVTGQTRFVNSTFDLLITIENTTHTEPFTATMNVSSVSGLALRWNATTDAFVYSTEASLEGFLSGVTASNVTLVLSHKGQTALFFDNQSYLTGLTFNITASNRSVYYQHIDGSGDTYELHTCPSVPSGPIAVNESCYTTNGTNTTLYLPRFAKDDRIVFGRPDNQTPDITLLLSSNLTQSVLPVDIRVVTPNPNTTLCSYNLSLYNASSNTTTGVTTKALLLSDFTQPTLSYNYAENITGLADGTYNWSVTCADSQGQVNTSATTFNLTDTQEPLIFNVTHSLITTSTATITGKADELVTFTVKYGLSPSNLTLSSSAPGLSLAAGIVLESLSGGTLYYYNLTGCDAKGQCNTSLTKSFTTTPVTTSGRSGGGGGGGVGDEIDTTKPEATESRAWLRPPVGSEVSFSPKGLVVSEVSFTFVEEVDEAKLTINQYSPDTTAVPEPYDGTVYKYLLFTHENLETGVIDWSFTVDESWRDGRRVELYRLGNGWERFPIEDRGLADGQRTYAASVPGLSWWVISVEGEGETVPEQQPEPAAGETRPEEEPPVTVPVEEAPKPFVSALKREKVHPAFIISGLLLLVSLLGIGGMKAYQVYKDRELEHERAIARERRELERRQHGIMADLYEYIKRMRAAGRTDEQIRERLLSVGWDRLIVEEELKSTLPRTRAGQK